MFGTKKSWMAGLFAAVALAGCGPQEEGEADGAPQAPQVDLVTARAEIANEPATFYTGIYRPGSGGHYLWSGVTLADFNAKVAELYEVGLRLEDVDVQRLEDGSLRFGGAWRQGSGTQVVRTNRTWAQLQSETTAYASQGLRLADVEVYSSGDTKLFAAVYRPGSGTQQLHQATWSGFVNAWETASAAGLRLVNLETYVDSGVRRFLGVFQPGTDGHALWVGVSAADLQAKTLEFEGQGLRLVDVVVYWENNAWRYGGVYRAGSGAQRLVIGDSWTSFINTWEDASAAGLRLMTLKSHQAPSWRRELDKALQGAMGYSYAIVEGGAVTASGGVGYARSPSESTLPGQLMSSATRVHLASVSKPITAVALMKLTERYPDVDLDDPFYPLVRAKYPNAGSGVANVTLRQLLTHRSGMPEKGYCGDNFHAEMTSLVASNLVSPPGGASQYSNGNYCLVRSVIESVSGMAYVDFVKTYVLAPMGITGMSCQPSTTLYYAKNSSSAGYFWNNDYTSQCGAYGWYGSANDLAKFLVGVRNHTVLSPSTTSSMNDGRIGWWGNDTSGGVALHHNGAWITGDGRGCNTGIMRLPNGVEAVVLSNTHGFNTIGTMLTGYEAGPYSAE